MIELIKDENERAIVVGLITKTVRRNQAEENLEELSLLADTAGASVVHKILQDKEKIDPAFYVGKGKVEQLARMVEDDRIDLIIFDDDLSPAQVRNLEQVIGKKILDRSGLILDIFASRALTNEARTQVELAQLQYLLPRLTRQWTHLSKQFGGIGTKGPGETQIETDRRMIRARISHLKEKLGKIDRQRETQRKGRKDSINVSLVGYTNAGKSTLLNAVSDSHVFVENRLFATLDTTTRSVILTPSTKILLSDTVGFIRKLPHHLVASFKSTLEQVAEADILLHVIDVCHPRFEDHIAVVTKTLEDLGAGEKPLLYVFNKIDALHERFILHDVQRRYVPCACISAERGINLLGLKDALAAMIHQSFEEITFTVPQHEYKTISHLHELTEITEKTYDDGVVVVKARVSARNKEQVDKMLENAGAVMLSSSPANKTQKPAG